VLYRRRRFLATVAGSGVLLMVFLVSCSGPIAPPSTPTVIPTAMASPVAMLTPTETPQVSSSLRVNLDEIFPPGQGRDLVLGNCTTCHSFVRIVLGQKDRQRWEGIAIRHRDRVKGLSDEQFTSLFAYLQDNFNDLKPEPKLPDWLRELW